MCATHCMILLLQLELFLLSNRTTRSYLPLVYCILFFAPCLSWQAAVTYRVKRERGGWAGGKGSQLTSSTTSHQIRESNGAIHSALTVAIGNNADLQRRTNTGRTQLCANGTSSVDSLHTGQTAGRRACSERERRAIGKGCAQRHPGSNRPHTVQRNDRDTRSARSRTSQVNGHYQRVWRLIHCALLAVAVLQQLDVQGSGAIYQVAFHMQYVVIVCAVIHLH